MNKRQTNVRVVSAALILTLVMTAVGIYAKDSGSRITADSATGLLGTLHIPSAQPVLIVYVSPTCRFCEELLARISRAISLPAKHPLPAIAIVTNAPRTRPLPTGLVQSPNVRLYVDENGEIGTILNAVKVPKMVLVQSSGSRFSVITGLPSEERVASLLQSFK